MLLTRDSVEDIPALASKIRDHADMAEDDLLVLLLLHEKYVAREASKWRRHISILPRVYHSIANYADEELELIKGSNLYVTTKRWKQQLRQDFEALRDRKVSMHRS